MSECSGAFGPNGSRASFVDGQSQTHLAPAMLGQVATLSSGSGSQSPQVPVRCWWDRALTQDPRTQGWAGSPTPILPRLAGRQVCSQQKSRGLGTLRGKRDTRNKSLEPLLIPMMPERAGWRPVGHGREEGQPVHRGQTSHEAPGRRKQIPSPDTSLFPPWSVG